MIKRTLNDSETVCRPINTKLWMRKKQRIQGLMENVNFVVMIYLLLCSPPSSNTQQGW